MAIRNYSDHAANERTFLAWLRTGLAVVAFGIVVHKLNFLLAALMEAMPPGASTHTAATALAQLRPYEGLALSLLGVAIIVIGGLRFVRDSREIDSPEATKVRDSRTEIALTGTLAFLAAALCASLLVY